jgi:hypothetical protein
MGTVSMSLENWYEPDAPVDVWQRDERPNGKERWKKVTPPDSSRISHLIQAGPEHFVAVLEGAEAPILTAEHATHVLEIILAAGVSMEEGCAVELSRESGVVSRTLVQSVSANSQVVGGPRQSI